MLQEYCQRLKIIHSIHLVKHIIHQSKTYAIDGIPGCVAGSRLPINNFVFTILVGPLIVYVRICILEIKKENVDSFQ